MPANKIEHLRNHLFATLEALQDEDKPMDLDRAKAVAEVGRVIIETAKVEVQFLKEVGGLQSGSGFFPVATADETPAKNKLIEGGRRA